MLNSQTTKKIIIHVSLSSCCVTIISVHVDVKWNWIYVLIMPNAWKTVVRDVVSLIKHQLEWYGAYRGHSIAWNNLVQLRWRLIQIHFDVIEWKHFFALLTLCGGIHWSPVNFSHKGQWRGALMFSLIFAWTNGWVNYRDVGDLRRHHANYDVTVMIYVAIEIVVFTLLHVMIYPNDYK